MSKCLFIGGSADGKIIDVPDGLPIFRRARKMPMVSARRMPKRDLEFDYYQPMSYYIGEGKPVYTFYVLNGISDVEMFNRLITSYAARHGEK
jgi:hypothetical protein